MQNTHIEQKTNWDFPPVVTVLGHVDHGKTTLLDALRKTSVAQREYGGITQGIGSSSVEVEYEGKKRRITFIDTPGHEAFTNMRSRGAQAADIGLLIVSAVDGVMPQTRESIKLLQSANLPIIVVLTMSDLPTKNVEKVKQQLLRENVLLEGYGGDIPVIEVSAKKGENMKELLDLILLVSELRGVHQKASSSAALKAIVIESKLDPRAGAKSTIIIKQGTLHTREEVSCEGKTFRLRTVLNYLGKPIDKASVGEGVEILGAPDVLPVGSIVTPKQAEVTVSAKEAERKPEDVLYHKPQDGDTLYLILAADTEGALEAIVAALPKEVTIVTQKTGEVTEADVLQAKATGALALSFNVKIRPEVQRLALAEKVLIKNYQIIYEMLDEIADVIEGKKQMQLETELGKAKILAKFPFEKTFAYGISIIEGRIVRGDKIRVLRGDTVIGETTIQSLRVGKNVTSKVTKGEAGIVLSHQLDITIGDMIISVA